MSIKSPASLPVDPPEPTRLEALPARNEPAADRRRPPDIEHAPPARDDLDHYHEDDDLPERPGFGDRMFGIGWFGWVRLAALSILVGALLLQAGVNPLSPDFTVAGSLRALGDATVRMGAWAVANGWMPLLAGAAVVLPLWLVWRLLSLPFRKLPDPHVHAHRRTDSRRSTIDIDS